jgi:hypothetical protein
MPKKSKSEPKSDSMPVILKRLAKAAENGNLSKLPKEELSLKNIAIPNDMGMNILHIAAHNEKLNKVPKDLFTKEILMARDDGDLSVLHYAAEQGQIGEVPKEFITREVLRGADNEGNTLLHYLANCGGLDKIPKDVIDEELVLIENDFGRNSLDMAIHGEFKEAILDPTDPNSPRDQSEILLRTLSEKTLRSIIKDAQSGKSGHGVYKSDEKKKIEICQKELGRRKLIKKVTVQGKDNTFEI